MVRPTFFIMVIGAIFRGCSSAPLADCEKGLCGHAWALELDSAVARGEARLQSQPHDENALLDLADAYRLKAWFIRNETETRADFGLASNLGKIDHILDDALMLCDKVLQHNQNAASAYQLKGKIFQIRVGLIPGDIWHAGNDKALNAYNKSILNLEKAVALQPNSAEIWYDLALAYREYWYGWRKSRECSKKAAELDPRYKPFDFSVGYSRDRQKPAQLLSNDIALRNPELVRMFGTESSWFDLDGYMRELRLVPEPAKVPIVLGILFLQSGYLEAEGRVYKEFVQANHHLSSDHLALARSFYLQQRPDTLNSLNHFRIWAQDNKGIGRGFTFSWWSGQKEIGSIVTNTYPSSPWAWIYSGRVAPPEEAIAKFKRAIALDSTTALPYYLIAATYAGQKDWSDAERWLQETLRRSAGDEFITLNAHLLSALVFSHMGKTSQVLRESQIALETDSAYTAYSLAHGIYGKGEHEGDHLRFLMDRPIGSESLKSPSDRKIATLLDLWSGWSYYDSGVDGEKKKFLLFFKQAIELDPENIDGQIAMATMYSEYALKDQEGIISIQNVLSRYRSNGKAHRALGDLYVVRGMLDKAKAELQRAYELGDFQAKATLYLLETWKAD